MKKVLIADDELLVRIGLKTTIPWEENGFLVIGEAKNGKEAIELFEEHDPDILLTDIQMPIISGLQLIKELKARKSALKAVILTHYDDFSYAKEAIKLGAEEYILKSDLTADNLLEVLSRISKELDSNKVDSRLSSDETGTNLIKGDGTANNSAVMKNIITGKCGTKEELFSVLHRYNIRFKYDWFVVATARLRFEDTKNIRQEDYKEHLENTINNISSLIFGENDILRFSFVLDENNVIYLFNLDCVLGMEVAMKRIANLMELLKRNMNQFLDLDIRIGLSDIGRGVDKIPGLFEKSRVALGYSFFEETEIAFFADDMSSRMKESPKISLEMLRGYVKTFESKQLIEYIDSVFDELFKIKNIDCARNVFIDFLSYAKIISSELNLKSQPAFNEAKFSYSVFDSLNTFNSVKKYVSDIYNELVNNSNENKPVRYSFIINKCIEYVKNNYGKNITLSDAAEYVQISKSYLSLLFKQETGINFSNFLTNYRIEKSKKLLKETNYKVYEIAEKIGFDNPYYFSKVFKEITGIPCKEFKRLNSEL